MISEPGTRPTSTASSSRSTASGFGFPERAIRGPSPALTALRNSLLAYAHGADSEALHEH